MAKTPVIALDVDGVLLDYLGGFLPWLKDLGYLVECSPEEVPAPDLSDVIGTTNDEIIKLITNFSTTESFSNLRPYPGAIETLSALKRDYSGIRIVAITSAGSSEQTARLRRKNLASFPLDDVTVLPLRSSKASHLSALPSPTLYIDDLPKHVMEANDCGHYGVLFRRSYNLDCDYHSAVSDWNEANALIRNFIANVSIQPSSERVLAEPR